MDAGDRLAVVFEKRVIKSGRVGSPSDEPTVECNRTTWVCRSQNRRAEGSGARHRG